ncbi:hypothetical protein SteCoe_13825 [Stentor coeruleus]|uniref:S5 DRBM domain-containing protein n=1 Tax=Stentor coeruleus TaxID=5963 RepID=A0A1R2C7J8_9CILI|nr:hypothetical protein SteCoe_13825 [Stentor coeruleus]
MESERLYDPNKLEKLQSLVGKHVYTAGVSLSDQVKKLAKKDPNFNEFLKKFKSREEPELNSYLDAPKKVDMKSYLKDPARSAKDRLDELHMHDQLRKKAIAEKVYEDQIKSISSHLYQHEQLEEDPEYPEDLTLSTKDQIKNRYIGENIYFNIENFKIMFIEAGSSTNITTLARVNKRQILLYMGNTDGIISYGKGVGISYQEAWDDAIYMLKKNVICIPIDHYYTTMGHMIGHFNDTTVEIFPARNNSAWGHLLHYNILALAGLNNFRFRLRSRNVNNYAIIYCFFKCLIQNKTPKMIAEQRGQKLYQITYGRGVRKDYNPKQFSL